MLSKSFHVVLPKEFANVSGMVPISSWPIGIPNGYTSVIASEVYINRVCESFQVAYEHVLLGGRSVYIIPKTEGDFSLIIDNLIP